MVVKKCFKCSETKDLSMFYHHKKMTDGHLGKCKECTKTDATKHRNTNIDKIRQYDKDRSKLPHRKILSAKCRQRFRNENPLAVAAHNKVSRALKSGFIFRPDRCSSCKEIGKVVGHHHNYEAPLDVVWLCQPCHKQLHRDTF